MDGHQCLKTIVMVIVSPLLMCIIHHRGLETYCLALSLADLHLLTLQTKELVSN